MKELIIDIANKKITKSNASNRPTIINFNNDLIKLFGLDYFDKPEDKTDDKILKQMIMNNQTLQICLI